MWIGIEILMKGDDNNDGVEVLCRGFQFRPDHMPMHKLWEQVGEAAPQLALALTFLINHWKFVETHDLVFGTKMPKTLLSIVFSFGSLMIGLIMGCPVAKYWLIDLA